MSGDIESEELLFPGQALLFRCRDSSREIDLGLGKRHGAEEAIGMCLGQSGGLLTVADDGIDAFEDLLAFAQGVEGADLGERFDGFFIQILGLDAFDEVFETFEFPAALPFLDDLFRTDRTDILDRLKTEADTLDIVVSPDDREAFETFIDVRLENAQADFTCLAYFDGDAVSIVLIAREERGHEFGRIVSLEIGGLITDHRVAGGMGPVETVTGKRFDEGKNLFGDVFGDVVLDTALDEFDALFRDEFLDFLSDGFAEHVGLTE